MRQVRQATHARHVWVLVVEIEASGSRDTAASFAKEIGRTGLRRVDIVEGKVVQKAGQVYVRRSISNDYVPLFCCMLLKSTSLLPTLVLRTYSGRRKQPFPMGTPSIRHRYD